MIAARPGLTLSAAASRLCAGALAAAVLAAPLPARAADNEALFAGITRLCIGPRNVDDAVSRATREPFRGVAMDIVAGPPFARGVSVESLGATVKFEAPTRRDPVGDCTFTATSPDVDALAKRIRDVFLLANPVVEDATHLDYFGRAVVEGRPSIIRFEHARATPEKADGAFTFRISDGSRDEVEEFVQAVRQLCLTTARSVNEAMQEVRRSPFASKQRSSGSGVRLVFGRDQGRISFKAAARRAPPSECRIESPIDEMTRLAGRLRESFGLNPPTPGTAARSYIMSGFAEANDERQFIAIEYQLQDNQRSGVVQLTVRPESVRN